MNKRGYLSKLSSTCSNLGVCRSNVLIVGGGASLLLGLREETADIDVVLPSHLYKIFVFHPKISKLLRLEPTRWLGESSQVTISDIDFVFPSNDFNYPTFKHRKFNVLTKLGLLMYRLDLGREKDLGDIKLLESEYRNLNASYKKRLKELLECQ